MQFVVPQFIDVENKIIGPISTRQFVLLVVMVIIAVILFRVAPVWLFGLGLVLDILVFGSFSFIKINSQPFHIFVLILIQTLKRPNLRAWNKETNRQDKKLRKAEKSLPKTIPMKKATVARSRLAELSLIVDTGGAYYDEFLLKNGNKNSEKPNIPLA